MNVAQQSVADTKVGEGHSKTFVVYDNDCGICVLCRKWCEALDWNKKTRWVPLQDNDFMAAHPEVRREECMEALHTIESTGSVRKGFYGFRVLAFKLPLAFLQMKQAKPYVVFAFRATVCMVLFFAAVNKMNPYFLSGGVIEEILSWSPHPYLTRLNQTLPILGLFAG